MKIHNIDTSKDVEGVYAQYMGLPKKGDTYIIARYWKRINTAGNQPARFDSLEKELENLPDNIVAIFKLKKLK